MSLKLYLPQTVLLAARNRKHLNVSWQLYGGGGHYHMPDVEDDYFVNNILTLYYVCVSKMHFIAIIYKFYLY